MFALFAALLFISLVVLAYRLGMLSNGLSTEAWERIPFWQRGGILLGIFTGCAFATLIVYRVLVAFGISVISSAECSAKARELTLRVRSQYVSRFREPIGDPDVDTLLEDLPLRGLAEKAKRFLEDNSDLRDAEKLYRQAISVADKGGVGVDEGELNQRTWNMATAYNKLGYHYRLVGNWDKALESLGNVFPLLDLLPPSTLVLQEKTAASFNFALVYMARFRQSKSPEDHRTARVFFEDCIERASQLGFDVQSTRKLLESLG